MGLMRDRSHPIQRNTYAYARALSLSHFGPQIPQERLSVPSSNILSRKKSLTALPLTRPSGTLSPSGPQREGFFLQTESAV